MSKDVIPHHVKLGSHVEIELVDQDGQVERLALDIVPENQADFGRGLLGDTTPLALAILGQTAGSELDYHVGDIHTVRILAVSQSHIRDVTDVEAQREAILKQAVERAERTNAEIFASSFSGKWGDYDPAGVARWDEAKEDETALDPKGLGDL